MMIIMTVMMIVMMMCRCEGGCHGHHSCVPLTTEERRVSVMLGKCGLSVGKCDKVRLMIVMMMMMMMMT